MQVNFIETTQAKYNALASPDTYTFYNCTDSERCFLGEQELTNDEDIQSVMAAISIVETKADNAQATADSALENAIQPNILRRTNDIVSLGSTGIWSQGTWRTVNESGTSRTSTLITVNDAPNRNIWQGVECYTQSGSTYAKIRQDEVPLIDGVTYTASMYAKGSGGTAQIQYGMSPYINRDFSVTEEWERYSFTFTFDGSACGSTGGTTYIYFGDGGVGTVDICGMKLEIGDQVTEWVPNPNDANDIVARDAADVAQTTADAAIKSVTGSSPISASTSSGAVTVTHATSGATSGSYGDSSAQTPAFGGTFKVNYETVNDTGHITAISSHNVTVPSTAATTSTAGLMSASDKTKLDGIATGATANTGTITGITTSSPLSGSGTSGSVALSHATSGVTSGTYGPTANSSPSAGGTFSVPSVTVDTYGHVTSASSRTITLPADNNTDTLVTQTVTTTSSNYPLLMTNTASQTATSTNTARFAAAITANPGTGTITATNFAGTATTATNLGTATVGGTARGIYLNAGAPTACSSTVGSSTLPVYMSSGTITVCGSSLAVDITGNAATSTKVGSSTVGSGTVPIYLSSGTPTASTSTVGSTTQPVFLSSGTITAMSGALSTTYGGTGNTSGRSTYSNVTTTNPTSGTTYYLPFTTGISSGTNYSLNGNNGIRYNTLEGTTSDAGYGRIYLGNSTATGTAGNKYGAVMIYGNTGYYWLVTGNSSYPSANRTLYMPRSTANGYIVATGAGTGTAVGGTATPVYISSGGIATACSATVGSASTPVYLNSGTITACNSITPQWESI